MAQQLRLGIVGCGEVTQVCHLPSLALLPDLFRVTALCDASRAVAEGVGDAWRVPTRGTDYRELVARADVDAVLVAAPHALHAEIALAALAAGKHTLIEKPMCLTMREAGAIVAAQRAAGVVAQVGYMRRHAPAFARACGLVRVPAAKSAGLATGTGSRVPAIPAGPSPASSAAIASGPSYSSPWTAPRTASVGPGRTPLATKTSTAASPAPSVAATTAPAARAPRQPAPATISAAFLVGW